MVTVSSNLFQGVLQNTIMNYMKELREGNNNLDAECTTRTSRDDVEGGYPVEIVNPEVAVEVAVCSYEDTEAGSPCSVTYPHLRTRQTKSHHSHLNPSHYSYNNSNNNSNTVSKNNKAGAGAVFGLSTSADRAARVVSPILGGVLIHHFHTTGLVVLITASVCYGQALLLYSQSIPCTGLTGLLQDGFVYCTDCLLHVSSVVEKALQNVHVKRGLDTEMLYYGGDKRTHEKYL